MADVVKPENLGTEFDLGNIENSKIRLRLGAGLQRLANGDVVANLPDNPTEGRYLLSVDAAGVGSWAQENKRYAAQISNSGTPNANTVAWVDVPLDVTDFVDTGFTISGNGIRCDFDGRVIATGHIGFTAAQTRVSPNIRLASTGTVNQNVKGKSGYIRNSANHQQSSCTIPGYEFEVVNGDIITLQSIRESTNGNLVPLDAGGGFLRLERFT